MKSAGPVLAAILCAFMAGCKSSPSNPLIGKWISTTDPTAIGAGGCATEWVFASDSVTSTVFGKTSMSLISYVVKPGEVFMVGQSGSTGFKFTGADTIVMDGGYQDCTYKRE